MDLRKKIMDRDYSPGQLLPSERELVKTYKVSRLTVREAISDTIYPKTLEPWMTKVRGLYNGVG